MTKVRGCVKAQQTKQDVEPHYQVIKAKADLVLAGGQALPRFNGTALASIPNASRQSRYSSTNLDGVNVVGDDHQLGLLGFNQGSDVVEAVLDNNGLRSGSVLV